MKDRFNILDTYAIVKELQHFNSYRLNNIYDIDNKTFLLKFDDFNNKRKCFIMIKSGQYLYHIYNPPKERRRLPSSFCMKLRKHIKNKRLQEFKMIKSDRVILLKFGTEEHTFKLIIELFSYGNIILCDKNDIILSLLRTHVYDNGTTILVNHKYPFEYLNSDGIIQNYDKFIGYYNNKEASPEYIENSIQTNTFNDALNNRIKIKLKSSIKHKKRVKLPPIESIKKHSKDKINKLTLKITEFNKKIEEMYENHPTKHENQQEYYELLNDYYAKVKELNYKIEKTYKGTNDAIEKLEKKEKKEKKQQKSNELKNKIKISLKIDKWYQKYRWFYTSNDHLVICGKNADQNEEIVKKHMQSNDIYLHSSVSGSGSTIIKYNENKKITPIDLEEAASFLICFSNAWKDKSPDSAYWVKPEQVSSTPESGEYIKKGSFVIRGKRNYIYRTSLELGCMIYNDKFMIAPYRRTQTNRIKITPGTNKRKTSINCIINKLNINKKEYDVIDKDLLYNIKIK